MIKTEQIKDLSVIKSWVKSIIMTLTHQLCTLTVKLFNGAAKLSEKRVLKRKMLWIVLDNGQDKLFVDWCEYIKY